MEVVKDNVEMKSVIQHVSDLFVLNFSKLEPFEFLELRRDLMTVLQVIFSLI